MWCCFMSVEIVRQCMSVGKRPPEPREHPRKVIGELTTYLIQYDDWDTEDVAELLERKAEVTREVGPILEARREE